MSHTKGLYLFDGETYKPVADRQRLTGQMLAVWHAMQDGCWHTLDELCTETGYHSQASISARLRDLRKERFGGHEVERRRRGADHVGLHEYRLNKAAEKGE
jgi:hypothetical protein